MIAFVIMYNRLTWPKKLCEDLEKAGCTPILIDNSSTYSPLLEWYKTECPYKVHHVPNRGARTLWENNIIDLYEDRYFIVTDHDISIHDTPKDFVSILMKGLEERTNTKCGLSLKIDDLPDNQYAWGVYNYEHVFWTLPKTPLGYYAAPIDTTLALYDRTRMGGIKMPFDLIDGSDGRFFSASRSPKPYEARHLPWYNTPQNITEEEQYYMDNLGYSGYWAQKYLEAWT